MRLDGLPQARFDLEGALLRVGPEEEVILLEPPGASHRWVHEGQMPELHARSAQVRHATCKVIRIAKGHREWYVRVGSPGPEPRLHHDPRAAPRSYEGPELLPRYLAALAARQHHACRQDVLAQPAILEGAHAEAVRRKPAADGGPRGARGIDRQPSPPHAQFVVQLQPRHPRLRLNPRILSVG